MSTVTLIDVNEHNTWPPEIWDSWPCQGLKSEFDLDPFLASVAERCGNLRVDELEVKVDHPLYLADTIRVPLSDGAKRKGGQTIYVVRVPFAEVVFWPELTLAVRDADTRAHLENVELRAVPTAFMGVWQRPGASEPFTLLASLSSDIVALRPGLPGAERAVCRACQVSADRTEFS